MILQKILGFIIYLVIRLIFFTCKIDIYDRHLIDDYEKSSPTIGPLMPVWHEQVIGGLYCMKGRGYLNLISRSKDGEIAATAARLFGMQTVRGSSKRNGVDKGGKEALLQLIDGVKKGFGAGITVDGPKGPRQKVKPGIIMLARQTGAKIFPVVTYYHNPIIFEKAWDKFKIPKPFSKISIKVGHPISVKYMDDSDPLNDQLVVENTLLKIEKELSEIKYES